MAHIVESRGKFYVHMSLGKDPGTGKKIQKVSQAFETEKLARGHEAAFVAQWQGKALQVAAAPKNETVGEFLDRWLADVKTTISPNTRQGYRVNIERAKGYFGAVQLRALRPDHIRAMDKALREGGRRGKPRAIGTRLSENTIKFTHIVLGQAFLWARDNDLIAINPLKGIEEPKAVDHEAECLTEDELEKVLQAAGATHFRPCLAVAGYAGLSCSELLGLRWRDVDFTGTNLHVRQKTVRERTADDAHGPRWVAVTRKGGKNKHRVRDVHLYARLGLVLRAHRESQERLGIPTGPDHLLFLGPDGKPYPPTGVSMAAINATTAAGFKHVGLHDLRHTFATICGRNGLSLERTSKMLGHANTTMTQRLYRHYFADEMKAAMRAVEAKYEAKLAAGAAGAASHVDERALTNGHQEGPG